MPFRYVCLPGAEPGLMPGSACSVSGRYALRDGGAVPCGNHCSRGGYCASLHGGRCRICRSYLAGHSGSVDRSGCGCSSSGDRCDCCENGSHGGHSEIAGRADHSDIASWTHKRARWQPWSCPSSRLPILRPPKWLKSSSLVLSPGYRACLQIRLSSVIGPEQACKRASMSGNGRVRLVATCFPANSYVSFPPIPALSVVSAVHPLWIQRIGRDHGISHTLFSHKPLDA